MDPSELNEIDAVPDQLLTIEAHQLHLLFSGPTLLHLEGRQPAPLFVSVLLHGNEPTSFLALQALLNKYQDQTLPRSLSIFFGNIQAARDNVRRLDDQPDYNRIWPGSDLAPSPEHAMAQRVVDRMAERNPFAAIDLHNNTGLNPHYACINQLDAQFQQLAVLFGRMVVYFIRPRGVLSAAFAKLCPSVTLECGKPGQSHGTEHALEYLDSCLHLNAIPDHPVAHQDIDLFHTIAQVTIPPGIRYGFDDPGCDFSLNSDLDRMNFSEIPPQTVIGHCTRLDRLPLTVINEHGSDVSELYFALNGSGNVMIKKRIMPAMLTLNLEVIRQDCLCYIMERIAN